MPKVTNHQNLFGTGFDVFIIARFRMRVIKFFMFSYVYCYSGANRYVGRNEGAITYMYFYLSMCMANKNVMCFL